MLYYDTAFNTPVDIINRALQHCGARRITAADYANPTTKNAKETTFCYDKLRRAELRRNLWTFATRRVLLRAVGTPLQSWQSTLSYSLGAYTTYGTDAYGAPINYISLANTNEGNEPDTSPASWQVVQMNPMFVVTFPTYNNGTAYSQGQIVKASDNRIYSYVNPTGSTGNDPTATTGFWAEYFGVYTAVQYDNTLAYGTGEIVMDTITNTLYASISNSNQNVPSTGPGWAALTGATAAPLVVQWPANTGPIWQTSTRNIYVLPVGYLRRAPQDPTAGRGSIMGFPSNLAATDWEFEGGLLISGDPGPILMRFVTDTTDVTMMDDMFCEGLAARIGLEVCEPLTQSTTKVKQIGADYKQFMSDARAVNAIEQGSTEPPLDDYILTRQ
jgi:hypothetical protein